MQKLLGHILAIVRRVLPGNRPATSASGVDVIAPPQSFRRRQVSESVPSPVYLRLLSDATPARRGKLGLLGASIGTVVIAGFTGPALGQSGEEACAFVTELRSPYTVERILRRFPNDPCIPVMLEALPSSLLRRVDIELIQTLPPAQLRRVDNEVLEDLGITTRSIRENPSSTTPIVRAIDGCGPPSLNTW